MGLGLDSRPCMGRHFHACSGVSPSIPISGGYVSRSATEIGIRHKATIVDKVDLTIEVIAQGLVPSISTIDGLVMERSFFGLLKSTFASAVRRFLTLEFHHHLHEP